MSAIPHTSDLSTFKPDPQMNKSWFRSRYESFSAGMPTLTTQKVVAAFTVVAACGLFVVIAYYVNQQNIHLRGELGKARRELVSLESENKRLSGNFNVIDSQLKMTERDHRKASEHFEVCSNDLHIANDQLEKLLPLGHSIQRCIDFQSQNEGCKVNQTDLIEKLSFARSAWETCALKQDKIQMLEVSLKSVVNENSRLNGLLETERGQCVSDKQGLQDQIDAKQESHVALQAEYEGLQKQSVQLEKSLNQTKMDMGKLQTSKDACERITSELQENILRDVKQSRDQLPADNSYWTYFFGNKG